MRNINMSLSVYYQELKHEFDRIQNLLDNQKPLPKFNNKKKQVRGALSADQIQSIKDEVHAEETHPWTNCR